MQTWSTLLHGKLHASSSLVNNTLTSKGSGSQTLLHTRILKGAYRKYWCQGCTLARHQYAFMSQTDSKMHQCLWTIWWANFFFQDILYILLMDVGWTVISRNQLGFFRGELFFPSAHSSRRCISRHSSTSHQTRQCNKMTCHM